MIFARQAIPADENEVVKLCRQGTAESFPWLVFSEEQCRATYRSAMTEPQYTGFVVEDDRAIVAFSLIALGTSYLADSLFVEQRVMFVRPDKRGTRAAAELVQAFVRWTDRLRPGEAVITFGNGLRSAACARFVRRFGFEPVGYILRKTSTGSAA